MKIKFLFITIFLISNTLLTGCAARETQVSVSPAEWNELQSFDKTIVFFTSASNPIKSLKGLQGDEVAMWGGPELMTPVRTLLSINNGKDAFQSLQFIGIGGDEMKFNKNQKLRLFITFEQFANDVINGGGVRIKFVKTE